MNEFCNEHQEGMYACGKKRRNGVRRTRNEWSNERTKEWSKEHGRRTRKEWSNERTKEWSKEHGSYKLKVGK